LPHLSREYDLNFFGGEPLLSFDTIREAVRLLDSENTKRGKTARYSLTTNGSLLTGEMLSFLSSRRFSVVLSFDGLAQKIQRDKGTFRRVLSSLESLASIPEVHLEVNSVFTPATVDLLSESVRFVIEAGAPDVRLTLTLIQRWGRNALARLEEEMGELGNLLLSVFDEKGTVPVREFREEPGTGIFACAAGQDRLAVDARGGVWGCDLFGDYFRGKEGTAGYREYFFGNLHRFVEHYEKVFPRVSSRYARLSMDRFSTPRRKCLLCPDLEQCTVCPIHAAFSGLPIGRIPSYACSVQKIRIRARERFRREKKAPAG